jgi:ABC-type multidrug transport system fused ATPase/permease subunit
MKTIKNLLSNKHFREYHKAYYLLIFITFFVSFLEVFSLGVMIPFVKTFLETSAPEVNTNSAAIINVIFTYVVKFFGDGIVGIFLLFGTINLTRIFITIIRDVWKAHISNKVRIDTQIKFFDKYIFSDYDLFVRKNQGDLVFNTISLPAEVSMLFNIIPQILIEVINFFMISSFLIFLSWQIYLSLLFGGLILAGCLLLTTKTKLNDSGTRAIKNYEKCVGVTHQMINGVKEIKINNLGSYWQKIFSDSSHQFYKFKMISTILTLLPSKIVEILFFTVLVLACVFFAQNDLEQFKQAMPLGVVYVFAIFRVLPSINSLLQDLSKVSNYDFVLRKFDDSINENTSNIIFSNDKNISFIDGINFKNVSFSYQKDEKSKNLALKEINFLAHPNKTVALVGHSGSGKTTLINLIMGFYQPSDGDIQFGEKKLNSLDIETIRNNIGYVSQDPFLFRGSIQENVTLFSKPNQERLDEALRVSSCNEFIDQLQDGVHSEVGDKGVSLSGGQRQRLCIARALYKRPHILILDEATSALDSLTERKITESLKEYSQDLSVIVLAHRLDTIKDADTIYVMDAGKIIESGEFSDLITNQGVFYKLYENREGDRI